MGARVPHTVRLLVLREVMVEVNAEDHQEAIKEAKRNLDGQVHSIIDVSPTGMKYKDEA